MPALHRKYEALHRSLARDLEDVEAIPYHAGDATHLLGLSASAIVFLAIRTLEADLIGHPAANEPSFREDKARTDGLSRLQIDLANDDYGAAVITI